MNRVVAALVGIAFVSGTFGFAAAQATSTTEKKPAEAKTAKKMSTKTATGTVKSASPDSLVVAGKEKGKDAEWTFAVDDKTKVKKAGKEAMAKDIAPGDKVTVRYMEHEGKATATSVSASAAKMAAAEKK